MRLIYLLAFALISMPVHAQFGTIDNGDFENWEQREIYKNPVEWKTSSDFLFFGTPGVAQSTDNTEGSYSAHIETTALGGAPQNSYLYLGEMGPAGPTAGIPYSDNFEAIQLDYKCDLAPGDSLYLMAIRYNGGVPVTVHLAPFAFGTNSVWTPHFLYVGNIISDSLFLGFIVGNMSTGTPAVAGSWARIDNIRLYAGSTLMTSVPNHSFETWQSIEVEEPVDWYTINPILHSAQLENVTKTTDSHSGNYAAQLETVVSGNDTISGLLSKGVINVFSVTPFEGIPFSGSPLLFSGSYKYTPSGVDEGFVYLEFFESGNSLEILYQSFQNQPTYTNFDLAVDIVGGVPDSIVLFAGSGENEGSVLKLDNLYFSGGHIGLSSLDGPHFELYPNPANNLCRIYIGEDENMDIRIYDPVGKLVWETNQAKGVVHLQTGSWMTGTYVVQLKGERSTFTRKLIVEH